MDSLMQIAGNGCCSLQTECPFCIILYWSDLWFWDLSEIPKRSHWKARLKLKDRATHPRRRLFETSQSSYLNISKPPPIVEEGWSTNQHSIGGLFPNNCRKSDVKRLQFWFPLLGEVLMGVNVHFQFWFLQFAAFNIHPYPSK